MRLKLDVPWETNGQGQLIVNPPIGLVHAKRADRLIEVLRTGLPGWRIWPEVGIHTADGVKAPDITAASPGFDEVTDEHGFLAQAPELCIEIMSPSNSWEEMRHKSLLYLAAGAIEAWVCAEDGQLHVFGGAGQVSSSELVADLPAKIE
jgi:Uma2 family endonuclease